RSTPPAADATQAGWHPRWKIYSRKYRRMLASTKTIAFVWWIPAEYFETARSSVTTEFQGFRDNTVFGVAFAKIAPFGILDFSNWEKIKGAVTLRDADGTQYTPMDRVPEEVRIPLEMMKPVFSASLGKLGENIQFLVFPGKDQNGKRVADLKGNRDFSVVQGIGR
ncbi:MAG TPA: hypothetical protein VG498_16925, partial [Terriglobales bacterium]|nr:hypothetical protein [Terriglobales bacterium]